MTNVGFSLDWLRFTVDYSYQDNGSAPPSFLGGVTREVKSILSYNTGVGNELHSVYWHTEHSDFRVMVELTGAQIARARQAGYTDGDLIKIAMDMGARFKRIDFAVDLFDTGGAPRDFEHCFETSQVMTVAQTIGTIEKKAREKTHGATVYIGSRESERFIRVYDKGKQQKTELDWIRVEMETKGKRAEQLGHLMAGESVNDVGVSAIREFVEWTDIGWFEAIFDGSYQAVNIDALGRPETDRERWLRTVVVPVVEKELESGSEWLYDALEALLQQHRDKIGHNRVI